MNEKFAIGDKVHYYKHGICYPSVIAEDLGILKGTGRRYRITEQKDHAYPLEPFSFVVSQRHLCKDE